MNRQNVLADMGFLYNAVIWGSTFFIIKDSLNFIDPVVLVGYRFLLAAGLVGAYLALRRRPLFEHFKPGLLMGFLLWLVFISQTIGLGYTSAANSGFITGLFVAFVPVFSVLLFQETPSFSRMLAVLVSLLGLWTLTGGLVEVNFGDLITLVSAMAYATFILFGDRFVKRKIDPVALNFQQFLVVGVLSMVSAAIFRLPFEVGSPSVYGVILYLSIFASVLAFLIQLVAQKVTPPVKVALFISLVPVYSAIFAWTLGGETFVPHKAVGGLFIFLAMVIHELPWPRLSVKGLSLRT